MKGLNLGRAFLLELYLLAALAYWGYRLDMAARLHLGAVLLYSTGRHALALLLEAATVVNLGLSVVWDQ
jgi:hypothetical protein